MTTETKTHKIETTRSINIVEEGNLEELVKKTKEEYGFEYLSKTDVESKLAIMKKDMVGKALLCDDGNVWFEVKGSYGNILHKFSWMSGMFGGGVAITFVDTINKEIRFTDYIYNRDALRKTQFTWTTDR